MAGEDEMFTRWFAAVSGLVLVAGVVVLPSTTVRAHSALEPVLPPASYTASECSGATPVVVGSDARAQSDIYSAVTLAGVVGTDCVILAGPRDGDMPDDQQSRLEAADAGGYVVGGVGALPEAKIGGRNMTRIAGADRWSTAQQIGSQARMLAGITGSGAPTLDASLTAPGDVQELGVYLSGAEPWIASDCDGDVPIVVGSDAAAQSDIYSAVTLAGVVGSDCVVLAGLRDGGVPASQQARLTAAALGGFVVGGVGAVPTAKLAGRDMTRLAGADRWETAKLVGRLAIGDSTAGTSTASEPNKSIDSEDEPQEVAGDETLFADDVAPQESEYAYLPQLSRGDLSAHVHICVEQGLEDHFAQNDLADYAAHYNRVIAPYYTWQSSGLLNVRFRPGQVIVSQVAAEAQDVTDWGYLLAPSDCLERVSSSRDSSVHVFVVYFKNPRVYPGGGKGGSGRASVIIRHLDSVRSAPVPLSSNSTFVVQHEFDHAIGAPHYNSIPNGYVRVHINDRERPAFDLAGERRRAGWDPTSPGPYAVHPDDGAIVGSLEGYPEEVGRYGLYYYSSSLVGLFPRRSFEVWPCYELLRRDWPTGEKHPACVRLPPVRPEVSISVELDGGARITWRAPSTSLNPEPVTGYEIKGFRVPAGGTLDDIRDDDFAFTRGVSADTRSLDLPAGTIDRADYGAEYVVTVAATSAVGNGASGLGAFQVLPATEITAVQRPSHGSVNPPIMIDLTWAPAPGASSYKIAGFEYCNTPFCVENIAGTDYLSAKGTTYVLSESLGHIDEGETYDITLLACGEDYESEYVPRYGLPPGCFVYASITITAEPANGSGSSALSIEPTPIGTCSWLHSDTGEIHPCSRVTWPLHPESDVYFISVGCGMDGSTLCPDGWRETSHFEFAEGRRVGFDGPDWPDGGWEDVFLTPGTRYLVRVYACPEPHDPGRCFLGGDAWLVGESWVTVPEHTN